MRDENHVAEGGANWILRMQVRDKGSIYKNILKGSAANLHQKQEIAVYIVSGWWKVRNSRKGLISVLGTA